MRISSPRLRTAAVAAAVLVLPVAVGAAVAQTPAAPPASSATPAPKHTRMTLAERFAQANTTNDGHLTLAQAQAGLPSVARHFSAIDKESKGYVTLDEIHAYQKEQRAMRHQAPANNNG
jgi:hypothetical protein